jgi:hypothetical protein
VRSKVLGAAIAALVLAATVATVAFSVLPPLVRGSVWGLVCLVSLAGWGALVERLVFGGARADLGLRLSWGLGAVVGIGGLLCSLSLATRPVLLAVVVGGAIVAIDDVVRHGLGAWSPLAGRGWPRGVLLALAMVSSLAVIRYLAGVGGFYFTANDDFVAYLPFAKKILDTGTLIEPYSLRRMSAYGGQSLLHAVALLGSTNPLELPAVDVGWSTLIVLALVLGAADARTPRALFVVPVAILLVAPYEHLNTASEMSGVVLFLALFRTATWIEAESRPPARAIALGLLSAAVCTLRQSNMVPAVLFLVFLYAPDLVSAWRGPASARRALLLPMAWGAASATLCILPWAVLSYRSNRTFLFPIIPGNSNPHYWEYPIPPMALLRFFWSNAWNWHPVKSLPVFLLAGLAIPARTTRNALPALLLASIVGFVAIVKGFPQSDIWNIARYHFAFQMAVVLAITLRAVTLPWTGTPPEDRLGAAVPGALVIAAFAVHISEGRTLASSDYLRMVEAIDQAVAPTSSLADRGQAYRDLQATLPAGAPVLAMLDEPFWMDFRRNAITLVDLPGAASPAPGMPLDDDEAFVRYLSEKGFRYLALVKPTASASLYKRDAWSHESRDSAPIWKVTSVHYLKMFDRVESLARSCVKLYDAGGMVVLDISAPQVH